MLKRIVLTALAAGAIAGAFMWAIQAVKVVPLIHHAELYEQQMAEAAPATSGDRATVAGEHGEGAWEPADGLERTAYTLLADLVIAVGFAFMLTGAVALRGGTVGWRRGIVWGLAGFAAFYAAPSLGLPPELPGMTAADLAARQVWWISTVVATAAGLALVFFAPRIPLILLGAGIVILPHLVGAPVHEPTSGPLPAALAAEFAVASLVTVQLFWMVLGGFTGYFYDRYGRG